MTKIVIADDESNILTLLEIMLRDLGATILSAENGEEAIDLAIKEKPDLIISDSSTHFESVHFRHDDV